jgi:hypothetical protein
MRIRVLLVACLIAVASILIATPAQAAPATVYIYKVYYNSQQVTPAATAALTPSTW